MRLFATAALVLVATPSLAHHEVAVAVTTVPLALATAPLVLGVLFALRKRLRSNLYARVLTPAINALRRFNKQ